MVASLEVQRGLVAAGSALRRAGRYAEAIRTLKRAIATNPASVEASASPVTVQGVAWTWAATSCRSTGASR